MLSSRDDQANVAMSGHTGNYSGTGGDRPYYRCTQVSPVCPVELTTLGYYPNRGINIFFAIGFGLAAIIALSLGIWKKTWSYSLFITAGCVLELAGVFCSPSGPTGLGAMAVAHVRRAVDYSLFCNITDPCLMCRLWRSNPSY